MNLANLITATYQEKSKEWICLCQVVAFDKHLKFVCRKKKKVQALHAKIAFIILNEYLKISI